MPEAVKLISGITGESDSLESRQRLETIYRAAGYLGAAQFYANTVREMRGQPLITGRVSSPVAWSMTKDDLDDRTLEVAQAVSDLLSSQRYADAIEMAKRDLEERAWTARMSAEWSNAVLQSAGWSPNLITAEAKEVALRVFLTVLEEKAPPPVGLALDTQAEGYDELAIAFFHLGDRISCRTAAELAIFHWKRIDGFPQRGGLAVTLLEELIRQAGGKPM